MRDFHAELEQAARERVRRFSSSSYTPPQVHIGTDTRSGEEIYLPIEGPDNSLGCTHTYAIGGSGVGKTKWAEGLLRTLTRLGYGYLFLDGKSDENCLFDNMVDYCARLDFEGFPLAERGVFINPNDYSCAVGINYLEKMGKTEADVLADLVLEALKKFYREDSEFQPWLEEWAPAALIPLIESGFTLLELFEFLNIEDPTFRDAVLAQLDDKIDDGFLKSKWKRLENYKPNEQAMRIGSLQTRVSRFSQSRTLRAIFGQQKTTIDWLKVMTEGGIVMARLGRTPRLSERIANLIGSSLIDQIMTIASERPKVGRRPFFVVVDEFQKFVNKDFSDGLELMRSYGISFILLHQHLDQLKEVPEIVKAVGSCCRNKLIFSGDPDDAEHFNPHLYSQEIYDGTRDVKDEVWQTKLRPIKTIEEIHSYSKTKSRGRGVNLSLTGSRGKSKGSAENTMTGLSEGTSTQRAVGVTHGISSGTALMQQEGVPGAASFLTQSDGESYSNSVVDSEGASSTRSERSGLSNSESKSKTGSLTGGLSRSRTVSEGETVTYAPGWDYEPYKELTSRTFEGLEEVKAKHIAYIHNQPRRHGIWKSEDNPAIQVKSPDMRPVVMTESIRGGFLGRSNAHATFPREEVLQEIKTRVPRFIEQLASGKGQEGLPQSNRDQVKKKMVTR